MVGMDSEGEIDVSFGNNTVSISLDHVERVTQDNVRFDKISFKIGKENLEVFANQYYFGEINLYEAKVKKTGKIQIIEREGKIQPLLEQNFTNILIGFMGDCLKIPSDFSYRFIKPGNLISIADEYHACNNINGKSERLRGNGSIRFSANLTAGFSPIGFTSFASVPEIYTHLQPEEVTLRGGETNRSLASSEWNTSVGLFLSTGFNIEFEHFRLGPVLRYSNSSISTDYYNVNPFLNEQVYSKFQIDFSKVDLGLEFVLQPNSFKRVNPFLKISLFNTISYIFDYSEEKYDTELFPNNALKMYSNGTSAYLIGTGINVSSFDFEVGYFHSSGTMYVDGPLYTTRHTLRDSKAFDQAESSIGQIYLSISYNFQIGKPLTWELYHK